jgi:hypothetical protein
MMATENKIPDQEENLSLLGVEKDVENVNIVSKLIKMKILQITVLFDKTQGS